MGDDVKFCVLRNRFVFADLTKEKEEKNQLGVECRKLLEGEIFVRFMVKKNVEGRMQIFE